MNTTVLVFHPHITESKVNAALAKAIEGTENVTVRYLYDIYPDGKINVEQEQLAKADRIILQYPVY